jgi:inner membrane protein
LPVNHKCECALDNFQRKRMDSITQVTLGAAIGDMVGGKDAGKKGMLWGGIAGLIPDLDIIFQPLYRQSEYFLFHRGISHSMLFTVLLAPLLALTAYYIHRNTKVTYNRWWLIAFLGLFTHPLLDIMTVYGTGFYEPFSNARLSLATINIVDPLYTLPLLIPLIIRMVRKNTSDVGKLVRTGFIVGQVYLSLTMLNSWYMTNLFEDNLAAQNVHYEKILAAPTLLNNVLWYGVAVNDTSAWFGFHSHLDGDTHVTFKRVPRNTHLAQKVDQFDMENLKRFSKGFYLLKETDEGIVWTDMRFGFTDMNTFVFNFEFDEPEKRPFMASSDDGAFRRFFGRILGDRH